MAISEKDLKDLLSSAMYIPSIKAESNENNHALRRLISDADALLSWKKLYDESRNDDHFYHAAKSIGYLAAKAYKRPSQLRTQKEIVDAAKRAAHLANELHALIESNETLQPCEGIPIRNKLEQASLDRILDGLMAIAPLHHQRKEGDMFPPQIEDELDAPYEPDEQSGQTPDAAELQKSHSQLTTIEAYWIVKKSNYYYSGFRDQLKNFAVAALQTAESPALLDRPKKELANEHIFSMNACIYLNAYYRQPHIEIVSSFASAVFEQYIDPDTVKKWWQRRPAKKNLDHVP